MPKVGQVAKTIVCSFCGAPAVGAVPPRGPAYWTTSCAHAAPVKRMSAGAIAELRATDARRRERRNKVIADCAGNPVQEVETK